MQSIHKEIGIMWLKKPLSKDVPKLNGRAFFDKNTKVVTILGDPNWFSRKPLNLYLDKFREGQRIKNG